MNDSWPTRAIAPQDWIAPPWLRQLRQLIPGHPSSLGNTSVGLRAEPAAKLCPARSYRGLSLFLRVPGFANPLVRVKGPTRPIADLSH